MSGLTQEQAERKVLAAINQRANIPLNFNYQDQSFSINLARLADIQQLINTSIGISQAFEIGHAKFYPLSVFTDKGVLIETEVNLTTSITKQINDLALALNEPAIEAQIKLEGESLNITPSQDGLILDEKELGERLVKYLQTGQQPDLNLPLKITQPNLSYERGLKMKKVLDQIKLNPLQLTGFESNFFLDLATLLTMLDLNQDYAKFDPDESFIRLDQVKLEQFLAKIAGQIDRPVKEPLFNFDPASKRVTQFEPPQLGLHLDTAQSAYKINQTLLKDVSNPVELVIEKVEPHNKLTNELGIKELVGLGTSKYEGSIANRIYNIELTAKKINGVLIPPGEIFSFNQTVGEISSATGFKQAYVIKSGKTVLDDGGGVCQVSTTLFRAALNAGLPIVKRVAHAYRVHYYEEDSPPGIDATIFYPSVDLKFKNDTPGNILIQAQASRDLKLTISFFGTSDGRESQISTPVILSQTPPPPELRQDDPTLPKGTIKQVDFAAWGANITFKRRVTRGDQVLIDETFRSNYKPWQAIYLVGTKEN